MCVCVCVCVCMCVHIPCVLCLSSNQEKADTKLPLCANINSEICKSHYYLLAFNLHRQNYNSIFTFMFPVNFHTFISTMPVNVKRSSVAHYSVIRDPQVYLKELSNITFKLKFLHHFLYILSLSGVHTGTTCMGM